MNEVCQSFFLHPNPNPYINVHSTTVISQGDPAGHSALGKEPTRLKTGLIGEGKNGGDLSCAVETLLSYHGITLLLPVSP